MIQLNVRSFTHLHHLNFAATVVLEVAYTESVVSVCCLEDLVLDTFKSEKNRISDVIKTSGKIQGENILMTRPFQGCVFNNDSIFVEF